MGAVLGWLGEISFGTATQTDLLLEESVRQARDLGHCPESTVQRESHLTPVYWLNGTSIITVQRSPCHLPVRSLFLLLPALLLLLLCSAALPASQIAIRRLQAAEKSCVSFCYWLCATRISCDRFLLDCLPAWKQRQAFVNYIQVWSNLNSAVSFLQLLHSAVFNVYCYCSENEEHMEKVITDVEMFMTRNKRVLALKYHEKLHSNSISGYISFSFLHMFWI